MNVSEINVLLEKFWNAESTQSEEAILHAYFNGDNVSPELLYAKPYFLKQKQGLDITTKIIQRLVDKYFEAETSVEEDGLLKEYFSQEEVHPSLRQYKMLFNVYRKASNVSYNKELSLPQRGRVIQMHTRSNKSSKTYWWKTAAAAACIGIASFFVFKQFQNEQAPVKVMAKANHFEPQTPEEALEMTKAALAMVSKKYKQGEAQILQGMKTMHQATDITN